jgi:hypothetical protein
MKRVLLIAVVSVVALLILVAAGGPLLGALGVQGLFMIKSGSGHLRLVRATVEPGALPELVPGAARTAQTESRRLRGQLGRRLAASGGMMGAAAGASRMPLMSRDRGRQRIGNE